ncbi:hypothetical protein [Acaryochloris marina]|uniref:hypothetical protein n=1 Tax=Acaryochloris marina TaxID=155978 RepID=UPI001BAF2BBE|nr:hypothetical protein [Acaryochloris marina]QUY43975.1 hypothetical protein I1H34_07670 [Acaryochloris marina S15]
MELSNPVASELEVDKPLQTSNPKPDEIQDAAVQTIPPIEDAVSLLESTHELEPTHELESTDDLDARLAEGRRSRAKTFSKVTNLFNKIFAE